MNRDELLRVLDLEGREAPPAEGAAPLAVTPADGPPGPGASPTALELDAWALRKGRELLAESERLRAFGLSEHAAADFFAAAFLPDPALLPDCAEPLRREFLVQLLGTPGYRALHACTRLRELPSGIAAASFAEQFARLRQEQQARPAGACLGREVAALRAAGRALEGAGREVGAADEAARALGLGPGSPGSNDPAAIAALYRRVRGDPALRRVCELAGRFRRVAQSRQRRKASHGLDDVVGVTLSGDPSRLLPVELARLAVPELEPDALRRLAERRCLAREHRAVERVGKGPVVVVVDESGSMRGDKVHAAKALALALAWVARRQRRWCALVAYSGGTGERLLALPPGRWDENALADWLCAFIGGGSELDVPLRELPRYFGQLRAPAGRTDVLLVTDALCRVGDDVQFQFLEWKRSARARVVSLVVGGPPGDLAAVSDECHAVAALGPGEEAVGRALSI